MTIVKQLRLLLCLVLLTACETKHVNDQNPQTSLPIEGTWRLLSGVAIQGEDTSKTDYTAGRKAIKMMNNSHFAFFQHDTNKGKDSTALFVSGGGTYALSGNTYRELLEYCNYREWENHNFEFEISIKGDTLIQTGIEKIEDLGVDRIITETYVKISD